jgi:hypothetical protein
MCVAGPIYRRIRGVIPRFSALRHSSSERGVCTGQPQFGHEKLEESILESIPCVAVTTRDDGVANLAPIPLERVDVESTASALWTAQVVGNDLLVHLADRVELNAKTALASICRAFGAAGARSPVAGADTALRIAKPFREAAEIAMSTGRRRYFGWRLNAGYQGQARIIDQLHGAGVLCGPVVEAESC